MTAPKPNITLADGTTRYLPPESRMNLQQLLSCGEMWMASRYEISISRLQGFGLIDGVKTRSSWTWYLTEHGKKVAQQLKDQQ